MNFPRGGKPPASEALVVFFSGSTSTPGVFLALFFGLCQPALLVVFFWVNQHSRELFLGQPASWWFCSGSTSTPRCFFWVNQHSWWFFCLCQPARLVVFSGSTSTPGGVFWVNQHSGFFWVPALRFFLGQPALLVMFSGSTSTPVGFFLSQPALLVAFSRSTSTPGGLF